MTEYIIYERQVREDSEQEVLIRQDTVEADSKDNALFNSTVPTDGTHYIVVPRNHSHLMQPNNRGYPEH